MQQYPLLADDFAADSRHYERNAFSSPDVPSPALFWESEGAIGSQHGADEPSVDGEDHLIGDHRGDGSASRGGPGIKDKEVGQPHATIDLSLIATSDSRALPATGSTVLKRTTESRPMTSNLRFRESVSSLDQPSPLTPRMGDSAAPNKQRSQESTLGSTAASKVHEDENDTENSEIFGIRGASLQPGRTPVVRDSSLGTSGIVGASIEDEDSPATVGASVEDEDSPISHLTEKYLADAAQKNAKKKASPPLWRRGGSVAA